MIFYIESLKTIKRNIGLIFNVLSSFYKTLILYLFSKFNGKFFNIYRKFDSKETRNKNGQIIVQLIEDFELALKIGATAKALSHKLDSKITILDCYWDVRLNKINFQKLFKFFGINTVIYKIYLKFGNNVVFSNANKFKDQNFINVKTSQIYTSLKCTSEILYIEFDNIVVGDLIYDTYLRYYHLPTINAIDLRLKYLIRISLDIFYSFKEYVSRNKVNALIQVYTTYITHGITARICLNMNINVFCVASNSYILQKIEKDFPYHGINHTKFNKDVHISQENLKIAKNLLESRFKGTIDNATSYMKNSSYFESNNYESIKLLFQRKERNIIIYTHDFFDSPHINRSLQFDDLYHFLKNTLDSLNLINDSSIFIKIHPNGLQGADLLVKELVLSYKNPNFYILNNHVSNLDIVKLKPNVIGTARGTIGMEMAYFSIPVVALYDNIYINYNFVHNANTKEEFYKVLKGEMLPNCNFDKELIYKFYYQAYIEGVKDDHSNILTKIKIKNVASYSIEYIKEFNNKITEDDLTNLIDLYDKTISKL